MAALYHDAVYVVGRTDNEVRSADLAERAIDRWLPTADARQVKHLIRLTAHHGSHGELGGDACLFLDCDMAILGASPGDFDAYEEAVGKEYRDLLDPEAWRVGRARFVERLLRLPRIFLSEFFHARLESRARANLSRSLSAIGTDSETARR